MHLSLMTLVLVFSSMAHAIEGEFKAPRYRKDQQVMVLDRYSHLDQKRVVPDSLLKTAVLYYDMNLERIPNRDVLGIVDFSKSSSEARWFIINMKSGAVNS